MARSQPRKVSPGRSRRKLASPDGRADRPPGPRRRRPSAGRPGEAPVPHQRCVQRHQARPGVRLVGAGGRAASAKCRGGVRRAVASAGSDGSLAVGTTRSWCYGEVIHIVAAPGACRELRQPVERPRCLPTTNARRMRICRLRPGRAPRRGAGAGRRSPGTLSPLRGGRPGPRRPVRPHPRRLPPVRPAGPVPTRMRPRRASATTRSSASWAAAAWASCTRPGTAGCERVVALKMLLGGYFADRGQRQRFRAEAEAVARLQHPNIVQIFEVGEHDVGAGPPRPYFTLEYVDGGSLDQPPGRPAAAAAAGRRLARGRWPGPSTTPTSTASSTAT